MERSSPRLKREREMDGWFVWGGVRKGECRAVSDLEYDFLQGQKCR